MSRAPAAARPFTENRAGAGIAGLVFAAYAGGIDPPSSRRALVTLIAFLAAVGTPPISGGAFLMLDFIFTQTGLPMEAVGVVAAIPFLGRFNTPTNSLGRLVVTAVVARDVGAGRADGR